MSELDNAELYLDITCAIAGNPGGVDRGCLTFCDGMPSELTAERTGIMLAMVGLITGELQDPSAKAALLERATKFSYAQDAVEKLCATMCIGAYNLFGSDKRGLHDPNGDQVVHACPIKNLIKQIPLDL